MDCVSFLHNDNCTFTLKDAMPEGWWFFRSFFTLVYICILIYTNILLYVYRSDLLSRRLIVIFIALIAYFILPIAIDPLGYDGTIKRIVAITLWDLIVPMFSGLFNMILCYWIDIYYGASRHLHKVHSLQAINSTYNPPDVGIDDFSQLNLFTKSRLALYAQTLIELCVSIVYSLFRGSQALNSDTFGIVWLIVIITFYIIRIVIFLVIQRKIISLTDDPDMLRYVKRIRIISIIHSLSFCIGWILSTIIYSFLRDPVSLYVSLWIYCSNVATAWMMVLSLFSPKPILEILKKHIPRMEKQPMVLVTYPSDDISNRPI